MEPKVDKRLRNGGPKHPRKRQKLAKPKQSELKGKIIRPAGRFVGVNDLAWKEVSLPDTLEDAEGFFGLEEIDDIEVVRDNDIVQYRVAGQKQPFDDVDNELQSSDANEAEDAGGSDWDGFADEDHSTQQGSPSQAVDATREESRNRLDAKTKSSKSRDAPPNTSNLKPNGFDILDESEDEGSDITAWRGLNIHEDILGALSQLHFSKPTPIQEATIPEISQGFDVIGKASTGSGKTLAFAIPIVEAFLEASVKASSKEGTESEGKEKEQFPLALILSPTRELAHQLSTHISDLCSKLSTDGPRLATLTGGLSIHKQERLLAQADIVIGTPGRLWEIMSSTTGTLRSLKAIKYLVIDEADRLLSEGHFKEVEQILDSLEKEDETDPEASSTKQSHPSSKPTRQTLVFSATFEESLRRKLSSKKKPLKSTDSSSSTQDSLSHLLEKLPFHSRHPKFIDVSPTTHLARNLRTGLLECGALEKDLYLYSILLHYPYSRVLVFTNSISSVRRLAPFLQNLNITTHALHSSMPQKARLRSIERFSTTTTTPSPATKTVATAKTASSIQGSVLVATNVAARGLDIPSVELIVHYHVPRAADAYVHRSGRTARAEQKGTSIMLCAPEEVLPVRRLVAQVYASSSSSTSRKGASKGVNVETDTNLRTLSIDPTVVARLKPRVALSQKLVSATISQEKESSERNWLAKAAEELGVEYDSDEFGVGKGRDDGEGGGGGKKKGMKAKVREEAAGASKGEVKAWRAELREALSKRVNLGVSEKYLFANGGVDVEELLREHERIGNGGDMVGKGGGRGVFLGRGGGIMGWEE